MLFRIADSFMKSLRRLDTQSQNLVRATTLEFQLTPSHPSLQFHKLTGARDKNFWSIRVNRDLRIIIHRDGAQNILLCWADHHDAAYDWAQNRVLKTHPKTGAAQIVEVVERIEEVTRREYRDPPVFERFDPEYLLALGVPEEWLMAVRTVDQEGFDKIMDRLPEEAAEHLLALLCGDVVPTPSSEAAPHSDPFEHPDAQRRFRVMTNQDELEAALNAPWDQWIVFLHPDQESIVQMEAKGPMRIRGGAGTGKTVVALHRAARLARAYQGELDHPVLLTTFSKTLAARLSHHLDLLLSSEPKAREAIEVKHLHSLAVKQFHKLNPKDKRKWQYCKSEACNAIIERLAEQAPIPGLDPSFLKQEWQQVVDAQGIDRWEDYKKASRKGRGTPLSGKQRKQAWKLFATVRERLEERTSTTWNHLCTLVCRQLAEQDAHPYAHVVVDECQDFGQVELELLRQLVPASSNDLCLCGDEGQRLYKSKVSLSKLGINIRGRSRYLRVNYRTTEQIRSMADQLHPKSITDGDGESLERDTQSLLFGLAPQVEPCANLASEADTVKRWIAEVRDAGCELHEIALFARGEALLNERVLPIVEDLGLALQFLSDDKPVEKGQISIGTMHRAKGLEFRAVAVLGCESGQVPSGFARSKIEDIGDIEDFENIERNLLYVACTRAREFLLITGCPKLSELLPANCHSSIIDAA